MVPCSGSVVVGETRVIKTGANMAETAALAAAVAGPGRVGWQPLDLATNAKRKHGRETLRWTLVKVGWSGGQVETVR